MDKDTSRITPRLFMVDAGVKGVPQEAGVGVATQYSPICHRSSVLLAFICSHFCFNHLHLGLQILRQIFGNVILLSTNTAGYLQHINDTPAWNSTPSGQGGAYMSDNIKERIVPWDALLVSMCLMVTLSPGVPYVPPMEKWDKLLLVHLMNFRGSKAVGPEIVVSLCWMLLSSLIKT